MLMTVRHCYTESNTTYEENNVTHHPCTCCIHSTLLFAHQAACFDLCSEILKTVSELFASKHCAYVAKEPKYKE
jgi:hypothetical protein